MPNLNTIPTLHRRKQLQSSILPVCSVAGHSNTASGQHFIILLMPTVGAPEIQSVDLGCSLAPKTYSIAYLAWPVHIESPPPPTPPSSIDAKRYANTPTRLHLSRLCFVSTREEGCQLFADVTEPSGVPCLRFVHSLSALVLHNQRASHSLRIRPPYFAFLASGAVFFFSASSLCLAQVRLSHLPRRTENKNENENEKKNENVGGVILVRILRTQYSVSYGISAQILRRLWCRTSRDFRCVSRSPVPHQPHQPGRVPPTRATRARRTGQAARGKPGTSAHQTRYLVQSACTSSFVPPLFRSACATTGT